MQPVVTLLKKHAEDIARDRKILGYPDRLWVRPRKTSTEANIFDCLIIGGGQSGLGVAFGLLQEKVNNILVIDENKAEQEGPWNTFARMPTLRTPKYLTGLDYGNPRLTFQAYFEAKYGHEAFDKLSFIPTAEWAHYLSWYKKILDIPVQNQAKARRIRYDSTQKSFEVSYQGPTKEASLWTRTIVLANGIDGSGQWSIPALIKNNLPKSRYAHTREDIDFSLLKNQEIAIIGAAASAFDNALMALKAGARSVHLFSRRAPLPRVNPYRWAEFVGFLKHHADLDDKERWRFISHILAMGQLPPKATLEHALSFPNFFVHIGEPWTSIEMVEDTIHIKTKAGLKLFDYLIVGTGFTTDLSTRPELALLKEHIALWQHKYQPPLKESNEELSHYPYLGANFEFQEKCPGEASYLSSIFCYNFGCLPSLGLGGGSISGLKYSLSKVVAGVTKQLFREDSAYYLEELNKFNVAEFEMPRDT